MEKPHEFDFAKLKDDYLDECAEVGGHSNGFVDYAKDYAEKHLADIPDRLSLFLAVARKEWRNKIKADPTKGDLWLDGKACPGEVSYADKAVPGGYVTVKFSYCSIRQFRLHCLETTRNANAVQTSSLQQWKMYEAALNRAEGDEAQKMSGYLDTSSSAA